MVIVNDFEINAAEYYLQLKSSSVTEASRQALVSSITELANYMVVLNILTVTAKFKIMNEGVSAEEACDFMYDEYMALGLDTAYCDFKYVRPIVLMLFNGDIYTFKNSDERLLYLSDVFDTMQSCPIAQYKNGVTLFFIHLLMRGSNLVMDSAPIIERVISAINSMTADEKKSAVVIPIVMMEV